MRLVKGSHLTDRQKREVLSSYVHRHLDTTCKTDEEWLKSKAFYITNKGQLSKRHKYCVPHYMADQ